MKCPAAKDNYDYTVLLQQTAFVASVKILLPQATRSVCQKMRVLLRRVAQKRGSRRLSAQSKRFWGIFSHHLLHSEKINFSRASLFVQRIVEIEFQEATFKGIKQLSKLDGLN